MGQITESFARLMLKKAGEGEHSPLTCWEEAQLAHAWLRWHGYDAPKTLVLSRETVAQDYPMQAVPQSQEQK